MKIYRIILQVELEGESFEICAYPGSEYFIYGPIKENHVPVLSRGPLPEFDIDNCYSLAIEEYIRKEICKNKEEFRKSD